MLNEEQFFQKLGKIPVLNEGWTAAWDYYSKIKACNFITKFALGVTETAVKKAADISRPVFHHFQPYIDSVNSYACSKLEVIESKYPIIRQPSKEMKIVCFERVQPVLGRIKPIVVYMQVVVDNRKKQVENFRTCSTNLVANIWELVVKTVSQAVNVALNNPPGQLLTQTVDGFLTCAEGLVDKFIPDELQEDNSTENKSSTKRNEIIEAMAHIDPSPQVVVVHFKTVSKKLNERMFRRVIRNFQIAKVHTVYTIGKLLSAVGLKVENPIVLVGRTLAHHLRSSVSALEKTSSEAGQFVQHSISMSKDFTNIFYQLSSNIKNISTDRARDTLQDILTKLKAIIDNIDWLDGDARTESSRSEEEAMTSTDVIVTSEEEDEDSSNWGSCLDVSH